VAADHPVESRQNKKLKKGLNALTSSSISITDNLCNNSLTTHCTGTKGNHPLSMQRSIQNETSRCYSAALPELYVLVIHFQNPLDFMTSVSGCWTES
jgi:hypothetical protein